MTIEKATEKLQKLIEEIKSRYGVSDKFSRHDFYMMLDMLRREYAEGKLQRLAEEALGSSDEKAISMMIFAMVEDVLRDLGVELNEELATHIVLYVTGKTHIPPQI